jgi:hypothetical protein
MANVADNDKFNVVHDFNVRKVSNAKSLIDYVRLSFRVCVSFVGDLALKATRNTNKGME